MLKDFDALQYLSQTKYRLAIAASALVALLLIVFAAVLFQKYSDPVPEVEIITVSLQERKTLIKASGTANLRKEIIISAKISGLVEYMSPRMIPGRIVHKDELMFRLDHRDRSRTFQRASAVASRAGMELAVLERTAQFAHSDWKMYQTRRYFEPDPLLLYEPALITARQNLEHALAEKDTAGQELEKAVIKAPCTARMLSVATESGEKVSHGSTLAVVEDIEYAEIVFSVSKNDLSFIDIPEPGREIQGSGVRIRMPEWPENDYRKGTVISRIKDGNQDKNIVALSALVHDPCGIKPENQGMPEVPSGAEVKLEIIGKTLENIMPVPERAIRRDSSIWIADEHQRLDIREVEVARIDNQTALVSKGIGPEDKIILNSIRRPVQGMKLRIKNP